MNMKLLPPGDDKCPICAVKHDPNLPHDATSLYYQYRFYGVRKRWPHWADAMAHCTDDVRKLWIYQLKNTGLWTDPVDDPIADPPNESYKMIIDL